MINQEENETFQKSKQIYTKRQKYINQLDEIEKYLNENNIWTKVYSNYETYQHLEFMSTELNKRIKYLEKKKKRKRRLTQKEEKALKKYKEDLR